MTNLLTRLKNTVMADLNAALDQKEKQNPIALLNQYLRQCEQETEKVGKLVERQATLKDEFAKELAQAVELSEKGNTRLKLHSKQVRQSYTNLLQQSTSNIRSVLRG